MVPRDNVSTLAERIGQQPPGQGLFERLAVQDGLHVRLRELGTTDELHRAVVRDEP